MRTFRKYQFGSKGAATTKINALGVDEEGNPTHSHSIVHLGNLVLTEGTYDEEGNELTAPVMSDTYHIDVLWDGEANADWDNQMVWCAPFGMLVMGASEVRREWLEACKVARPELFPEPTLDEL